MIKNNVHFEIFDKNGVCIGMFDCSENIWKSKRDSLFEFMRDDNPLGFIDISFYSIVTKKWVQRSTYKLSFDKTYLRLCHTTY